MCVEERFGDVWRGVVMCVLVERGGGEDGSGS